MVATCRQCGVKQDSDLAWCGMCLEPHQASVERPGDEIVLVLPGAQAGSILEGGATSLGLTGKFAISLLLTLGAMLGVGASGAWLDVGRPMQALVIFLAVAYSAVAAAVLRWTWRPGRRAGQSTELIVVVNAASEAAVQRRHKALAHHA